MVKYRRKFSVCQNMTHYTKYYSTSHWIFILQVSNHYYDSCLLSRVSDTLKKLSKYRSHDWSAKIDKHRLFFVSNQVGPRVTTSKFHVTKSYLKVNFCLRLIVHTTYSSRIDGLINNMDFSSMWILIACKRSFSR